MPLLYDPITSVITYQGKPAGEYVVVEGVARVTLAFTCDCDRDEWLVAVMGLHEGLSHLKDRHPKHPAVPFMLETTIRYEAKAEESSTIGDVGGHLTISLAYECDPGEWIVPLSYFHGALNRLNAHQPHERIVLLTIEMDESDIAETNETAILYLAEKKIKQDGYKWCFHKNDPDDWPSNLHGHDYERNLKLDAYTGNIYDVATRQHWKTLTVKKLRSIQEILRCSPDFSGKLKQR